MGLANTIQSYLNFQPPTLQVGGFGMYKIEWHVVGDLKTLKCLYGYSLGVNTKFTCLYCKYSWKERNNSSQWRWGIFPCNQGASPSHGGQNDEWDPILALHSISTPFVVLIIQLSNSLVKNPYKIC